VERVEQLAFALRYEADAGILDAQSNAVVLVSFDPDRQMSCTIVNADHRVRRVADEVQDNLLKLNTIAHDWRKAVDKLGLKVDSVSLEFANHQGDHLLRRLVQVNGLHRKLSLAEERP